MKLFLLIVGLLSSTMTFAAESTVTVPWHEFESIYEEQLKQSLKVEKPKPDPVITLESAKYNLSVHGAMVSGSVSISGSVLVGEPEPVRLFGPNVAVTGVLEAQNVALLAGDEEYALYTFEPGVFSIRLAVSIPITDFQVKPGLVFNVPSAVRNELKIKSSANLKILASDVLHEVDDHYFFSPRRLLMVDFEHLRQPFSDPESEDILLSKVDTPEAVLNSVTFFTSFAEDGTVLTAMNLLLPPNDSNKLELNPVAGAEVWSLHVNDKPRSLYLSAANKWVIALEPKVESKVMLAYLTHGEKLGLEGRLDFEIPETGLTARNVNLVVGLPERMHMLAMDTDLQPAKGRDFPVFNSFSGRAHYFSKPFYRGQHFSASIIYQEPVNP